MTFSCAFTGRGANYRKHIVFRAAGNKLIYEGARAKLLTYLSEHGSLEPLLRGSLSRIPQPLSDYVYSRKDSPQWLEVVKPRVPGGCFDQLELTLLVTSD